MPQSLNLIKRQRVKECLREVSGIDQQTNETLQSWYSKLQSEIKQETRRGEMPLTTHAI